jgi:hypothetical protein
MLYIVGQFQWLLGLRRVSAAFHLLGLWVRTQPGEWRSVFVIVVCWQVEVSASGWLLVQRSPTGCGVSECNRKAPIMRRSWPIRESCAIGKKMSFVIDEWVRSVCGMILTEEDGSARRRNLSNCHFVYHKSHIDCGVFEAGPPRWDAGY